MTFQKAADLSQITDGAALAIELDGKDVVLIGVGDQVFAMEDMCSHAAVPLSEGDVEGCEIECWLHGSRFDVRTGAALNPPAVSPVPTYATQIDGDVVLVDLDTPNDFPSDK
ncbi:MAG TPA: non-heme iron oxygenase ferredoxin subunit [Aeromicrobium sp.]|nr:non-heme iron oxygenase ferredoxin subunit [Aeromicrobium sp.]